MIYSKIKLDGIDHNGEAGAEGKKHTCDWPCIKNPTMACAEREEELYQEQKALMINRSYDIIRKPSTKDNLVDQWDAVELLSSLNLPLRPIKNKRGELGAREFTLTYSPKWMTDDEARLQMIKAMNKLYNYYEKELVQLRAVGEVGSNGLSHIHVFYKLAGGLKITDKNFKRAWKWWNPAKKLGWGFEGGHHANVKNESDFLGYIDKDVDTAWYDRTLPAQDEPTNISLV